MNSLWIKGQGNRGLWELFCFTFGIHYDTVVFMNPKPLSIKALESLKHIRNFVAHHGKVPSVRVLMKDLGYKSPRSAMLVMRELEEAGHLRRRELGDYMYMNDPKDTQTTRTILIPLVGSVPCGLPILAVENQEAMIPVSTTLARPGSQYFLLRAIGDSMDKAGINKGDLMLVRQQNTAEQGQKVVALIDDKATVKEFHRAKDCIILKPNSNNPANKPIILTKDFRIQGVVVATIPKESIWE